MTAQLSDDVVALLRSPVLVYAATVMADGTPQVTPVWADTDGSHVLFNTALGRVKHRNLERNPAIALSFVDPENPYRVIQIRGEASFSDEGADAHIDGLAKKYLGVDSYPFRQEGEQRVIVTVTPKAVSGG